MFTTPNSEPRNEFNIEDMRQLLHNCNKSEQSGYIVLPNIDGLQFFEIEVGRLKQFLQIESIRKQRIKDGKCVSDFNPYSSTLPFNL